MTRKRRKFNKAVKEAREKKRLREQARISNVLSGLGDSLTIKDIHRKTGMTEKNIRKIIHDHAEEITFLILTREGNKKK